MDHFANVVEVNCWHLWENYELARTAQFCHGPEFLDLASKHYNEGRYIDVHCWVFTPAHFVGLMGWMADTYDLTFDLRWLKITPSYDLQFFIQLTKSPTGRSETNWANEAKRAMAATGWPGAAPSPSNKASHLKH